MKSQSVTVQMKATEQYFFVVLFFSLFWGPKFTDLRSWELENKSVTVKISAQNVRKGRHEN